LLGRRSIPALPLNFSLAASEARERKRDRAQAFLGKNTGSKKVMLGILRFAAGIEYRTV
jgi:hypothetical protein